MVRARSLDLASSGSSIPARMAMIAMTTNSSISVNAGTELVETPGDGNESGAFLQEVTTVTEGAGRLLVCSETRLGLGVVRFILITSRQLSRGRSLLRKCPVWMPIA